MSVPQECADWIVNEGDAVIRKKAATGIESLTPKERLVYCLWVADYSMGNAGDLDTAEDVHAPFMKEAAQFAAELGLAFTNQSFSVSKKKLQKEYYERLERIVAEIRRA